MPARLHNWQPQVANELGALVKFAGRQVDDLVLAPAESLHTAVARRVFGSVGPIAAPARFVHDHIARATYMVIRSAMAMSVDLAEASIRLVTGEDLQVLSRSRRGRASISALNALAGDVLEECGNELAIQMSVCFSATAIACERGRLRAAFPKASGRLAVFLHGLGETPDAWQRRRHEPFGRRLRRDFGITPVYLRYNTGLHISDNGRRLSELLDDLIGAWPVDVTELILIGHSMGGLVARSACHAGTVAGRRWPSRVKHLITLGSPHTGVPLEKLVHLSAWMLRVVPESKPLADILDRRSAGIRDLRFGYLVEEDWKGEDPNRLLHDNRSDVPPLGGCTHTFISSSLSGSRHPLGWAAGDLLVRPGSAGGRRADGSVVVRSDNVFHLTELNHFDLLDHPIVYEHIRRVLE